MNILLKVLATIVIACNSMTAFTQTTTICGGTVPAGWVTTAIGSCQSGGSTLQQRTITFTGNLPTGATLNICDDTPPAGWITTSMNQRCVVGVNSYEARTIKKIEGLPTGTTLSICKDAAPSGWITIAMNQQCVVGVNSYVARTIKKIEGLPTGTTQSVCSDPSPAGWITISMDPQCVVGVNSYEARTIQKIEGMAAGTILNTCKDPAPTGWITTAMSKCTVGVNSYDGRTIQKIDCMPIGTVIQVCNDAAPAGWTTTATGTCRNISDAVYSYTSRTIQKVSGSVAATIASFSPALAQPGQSITINGSGFSNVASVSIGGTAAQSFTVVNETTITAIVSSQNASGNVSVTTGCGTVNKAGFTFCAAIISPSVTISTTPSGMVCEKTPVIFNAIPNTTNAISYQWKKNGVNVGTNNAVYTDDNLRNGDIVTCVLNTSNACASVASATSNAITMSMYMAPNLGADTSITANCLMCPTNLDATYHSTTYYSSQWVPTNAANAYPGKYQLTVATIAACKDTVEVWLNGKDGAALLLCNGGKALLQSSLSGNAYQWEVNNGTGYQSITNSINYQGATTASLTLNNIPDSWYGYKYRCKVDGVYTTESVLKFVAVWNGLQNSNWESLSNWGCGQLPGANTDIYINSGTVMLNSNQVCRSLTIGAGAAVTVQAGYNLTVLY